MLALVPWMLGAHGEDTFDDHGQITHIIHRYENEEASNELAERNRFRREAFQETERLFLVPITPAHNEGLLRCFSDKETMHFYQDGQLWEAPYLTKRMQRWINRWDQSPFSWWTLFLKKKDQDRSELDSAQPSESVPMQNTCIIGAVGSFFTKGNPDAENPILKEPFVELAYLLHHDYHQQGYMSEAFDVILRYIAHEALQMDPPCTLMGAPVRPDNEASIRLLKKVKFRDETEKPTPDEVEQEGKDGLSEATRRLHFRRTCEPKVS